MPPAQPPSTGPRPARFLRLDHEEVDSQALALSRQIARLRARLDSLLGDAQPGHGGEAARLRDLIDSRRAYLVSLERMRRRAAGT